MHVLSWQCTTKTGLAWYLTVVCATSSPALQLLSSHQRLLWHTSPAGSLARPALHNLTSCKQAARVFQTRREVQLSKQSCFELRSTLL